MKLVSEATTCIQTKDHHPLNKTTISLFLLVQADPKPKFENEAYKIAPQSDTSLSHKGRNSYNIFCVGQNIAQTSIC